MSASLPAARGPVGEGAEGVGKGRGSGAMTNSGEEVAGKSAEEELEELEALYVEPTAPAATVHAHSAAAAVPPASHVCVVGLGVGEWVGFGCVGGGVVRERVWCVCVCVCVCGWVWAWVWV
jgi:hypothetical protein